MDLTQAISSFISAHARLILDVGKVVLALIMLSFSLFAVLIIVSFVMLKQKLQAMELSAYQTREETVALFTQTRAGLRALRSSVVAQTQFDTQELLRSGGQLVMLLLSTQRNPMAWGMLGLNLAKNAVRYLFSRR